MKILNLLLVEDNPVNQTYLKAIIENISGTEGRLGKTAFNITLVESLSDALTALTNKSIDIILLDLTLTDSIGLNTFEAIHEKSPMIPVIILTGVDDTEVAVKAVELGAQDYLLKGKVDKHLLYRSINYALQRTKILLALKESEERYSLVIQATNDGIWEWNLKNNTVYFSDRWGEILGCKKGEIKDNVEEWFNRIHPDDVGRVEDELHHHMSNKSMKLYTEHRLMHKNGSYIWVRVQGMASLDEQGMVTKIAGSLTDITSEKLQDSLTGLPNKILFLDRIKLSLARLKENENAGFVILLIELENYKLIASNFGPYSADYAMLTASDRITKSIKNSDTLARTGPSEFGVILYDNTDVVEVNQIVNRIHKNISKPLLLKEDNDFSISVSIGIVFANNSFDNESNLYRDAVTALQRALQKGRGSSEIYDSEMRTKTLQILQMESRLIRAFERQEFSLHYQPIISLKNNNVSSLEALLRWQNDHDYIAPSEFIPIAEETDLILRLGSWVIEEVALQLQRWKMLNTLEIPVAINISSRQFKNDETIEYLKKTMDLASLDYKKIIMEITESIAMENYNYTFSILSNLYQSGFTISIDDFGTGYSSLSYLRKFPINMLKIDKSFISEIPNDPDSAAIVTAMIQMAHALSYEVVVEGIETKEQYDFCKKNNADYAQGYYISRPLNAEEIANFILNYQNQ